MLDIQEFLKIAISNGMEVLQSQEGNNEYRITNKELPFYASCKLCGKKMYISPASDFLSKEIIFLNGNVYNNTRICCDCEDDFANEVVDLTAEEFGLPKHSCGIRLDVNNCLILRYEIPTKRYDNNDDYVYMFINTTTGVCLIEKIDCYGNVVGRYEIKQPTKDRVKEFIDIITEIY